MNHLLELYCECCGDIDYVTVIAPPTAKLYASDYYNPMAGYKHVCDYCAVHFDEDEETE